MPDKLSLSEAADYLGVSKDTLRHWRAHDRGPYSWLTPGNRVVYRRDDLDRYLDEHAAATGRGGR